LPGEVLRVLALAIGLAALLIWAAFIFFGRRLLYRSGAEGHEDELGFEMNAAPWSDRHVESLLEHNPRSPTLLNQYVAIAIERKDWPEALRRADIFAVRAPRSPQAWVTRADVLRRAGREEEAVALLRTALRRMPKDPDILAAWAYEAVWRMDWAEAARRFERVRQHGPERVDGYEAGASVLISDGRGDEAEVVIAEGLRRVPKARTWEMLPAAARVAERLGNHDEAIHRWEVVRDRHPSNPAGFLGGADALARVGRGGEAAALIRQASDFFPGNKTIAEAAARLAPPETPEPAPPEAPAQ
jgi:Flp pilus assembly protein TadD